MRDQPTWHVGGWQWSCAGCAGAGRGASWGRWRPSDARQVGWRVRRERRLSLVTLLALAARHTRRAHTRTQSTLCTGRQVIDGPWQVLKTPDRKRSTNTVYLRKKGLYLYRWIITFHSILLFISYTCWSINMLQFVLCCLDTSGTQVPHTQAQRPLSLFIFWKKKKNEWLSWLPRFVGFQLSQHVATAALPCDFNTQTNSCVHLRFTRLPSTFSSISHTHTAVSQQPLKCSRTQSLNWSRDRKHSSKISDIQSNTMGILNVMSLISSCVW